MVLSSRDYYSEAVARKKRTAVTPDTEDEGVLVPESPPGLAGESQGGTSITLAEAAPEATSYARALGRRPPYLPAVSCRTVGAPGFHSALKARRGGRWSKAEETAHREVRGICRGRRTRRIATRKDW